MNAQELLHKVANYKVHTTFYCEDNGHRVTLELENGSAFEFECCIESRREHFMGNYDRYEAPYDDFEIKSLQIIDAQFDCEPFKLDDAVRKDTESMLRERIEEYVNENGYEDIEYYN